MQFTSRHCLSSTIFTKKPSFCPFSNVFLIRLSTKCANAGLQCAAAPSIRPKNRRIEKVKSKRAESLRPMGRSFSSDESSPVYAISRCGDYRGQKSASRAIGLASQDEKANRRPPDFRMRAMCAEACAHAPSTFPASDLRAGFAPKIRSRAYAIRIHIRPRANLRRRLPARKLPARAKKIAQCASNFSQSYREASRPQLRERLPAGNPARGAHPTRAKTIRPARLFPTS